MLCRSNRQNVHPVGKGAGVSYQDLVPAVLGAVVPACVLEEQVRIPKRWRIQRQFLAKEVFQPAQGEEVGNIRIPEIRETEGV